MRKIIELASIFVLLNLAVGCQQVADAISEASESLESSVDKLSSTDCGDQPDHNYASSMNDNFDDFQMYEADGGYELENQSGRNQSLPCKGPTSHNMSSQQNQQGMGIDGSQIEYGYQYNNPNWRFQTPPRQLMKRRGNNRVIGVHPNGAPIYGQYVNDNYSGAPTDKYGGRYGATRDFPQGIYYYVIKVNVD